MIELTPFQAVFAAAVLILLVISVFAFAFRMLRHWLRQRMHDPQDRQRMKAEWGDIQQMRNSNDPHQLELAVIRSDRLLDQLLKSMMLPGTTLAERLKVAGHKYPELKDVWWAHKVRNDLVHEHHDMPRGRLKGALNEFEKAFQRLGLL